MDTLIVDILELIVGRLSSYDRWRLSSTNKMYYEATNRIADRLYNEYCANGQPTAIIEEIIQKAGDYHNYVKRHCRLVYKWAIYSGSSEMIEASRRLMTSKGGRCNITHHTIEGAMLNGNLKIIKWAVNSLKDNINLYEMFEYYSKSSNINHDSSVYLVSLLKKAVAYKPGIWDTHSIYTSIYSSGNEDLIDVFETANIFIHPAALLDKTESYYFNGHHHLILQQIRDAEISLDDLSWFGIGICGSIELYNMYASYVSRASNASNKTVDSIMLMCGACWLANAANTKETRLAWIRDGLDKLRAEDIGNIDDIFDNVVNNIKKWKEIYQSQYQSHYLDCYYVNIEDFDKITNPISGCIRRISIIAIYSNFAEALRLLFEIDNTFYAMIIEEVAKAGHYETTKLLLETIEGNLSSNEARHKRTMIKLSKSNPYDNIEQKTSKNYKDKRRQWVGRRYYIRGLYEKLSTDINIKIPQLLDGLLKRVCRLGYLAICDLLIEYGATDCSCFRHKTNETKKKTVDNNRGIVYNNQVIVDNELTIR